MRLAPDTKLGFYEITGLLGAGGMGEVYRARDMRLGRDVALKVLPEAFASDTERMARFEREAKVLGSLNHSNIASIYGLEESGSGRALVMELIEGPALSDRIKSGAVPVDEALPIARQIAEALEYAHERGIIHRDLKPSNVKLTREGAVKVLDFGLAKALERDTSEEELQNSPTLTAAATRAGILLGTAAYMSPEQARGKRVDRRADIWAFGCVLYEMLTGQCAFGGETTSDTLAAVIRAEPDWSSIAANTPMRVRELLRRCLQKDPRQRLRDIGDARIAIEEVLAGSPGENSALPGGAGITAALSRRVWMLAGAALALGALVTALVFWNLRTSPEPRHQRRIGLALSSPDTFPVTDFCIVAISPDSREIAYVVTHGGVSQLYLRSADRFDAAPLAGTANARSPFFSPNGEWIGFVADGKLKKMSIRGGEPVVLADAPNSRGASWGPDDTIIFSPTAITGLERISAAGGAGETLTKPDAGKDERTHRWPQILPGGKAVLFTIGDLHHPDYFLDARIAVERLDTGERKILPIKGTYARYASSGHLLLMQEAGLIAVPFDLKRLEVTGTPVPAANDVAFNFLTGAVDFDVSNTGELVYIPKGILYGDLSLAWLDRHGKVEKLPVPPRAYREPHLSPDGKQIAVTVGGQNTDIWEYDISRGTLTRVTFDGTAAAPVWSPDGKRIAYASFKNGQFVILWKPADGSGMEEVLVSPQSSLQVPLSFTPDGKFLAYMFSNPNARLQVNLAPLHGERTPKPFVASQFDDNGGLFSPDGRWLAYFSNESGQFEVYVQPFPGPGGRWQISASGGYGPVWARSGRELFYTDGNQIFSAGVTTQLRLVSSTPRPVVPFTPGVIGLFSYNRIFDVAPDGQRFLVVEKSGENTAPEELRLVEGWLDELARRRPPDPNERTMIGGPLSHR